MKKSILSLSFLVVSFFSYAQDQDPKAKAILDEVSKLSKTYKTISTDVLYTEYDKDKKAIGKPQTWKVQVKGQKFKLEIPGSNIVCDGKTVWNYNKDAKEVTIKNFDLESDEQNPAKLFTLYEKGYKFKFDKEEKSGAVVCEVIDLYPLVKPEKKKFHTVKIYVDKIKKQVLKLNMVMKDGTNQVYEVKTMKTNLAIDDQVFVFDTKGLKADQISDERE